MIRILTTLANSYFLWEILAPTTTNIVPTSNLVPQSAIITGYATEEWKPMSTPLGLSNLLHADGNPGSSIPKVQTPDIYPANNFGNLEVNSLTRLQPPQPNPHAANEDVKPLTSLQQASQPANRQSLASTTTSTTQTTDVNSAQRNTPIHPDRNLLQSFISQSSAKRLSGLQD